MMQSSVFKIISIIHKESITEAEQPFFILGRVMNKKTGSINQNRSLVPPGTGDRLETCFLIIYWSSNKGKQNRFPFINV